MRAMITTMIAPIVAVTNVARIIIANTEIYASLVQYKASDKGSVITPLTR